MNVLHSTWFWLLLTLGPICTVVGILTRLARSTPPPPGGETASAPVKDGEGAPPPP